MSPSPLDPNSDGPTWRCLQESVKYLAGHSCEESYYFDLFYRALL